MAPLPSPVTQEKVFQYHFIGYGVGINGIYTFAHIEPQSTMLSACFIKAQLTQLLAFSASAEISIARMSFGQAMWIKFCTLQVSSLASLLGLNPT